MQIDANLFYMFKVGLLENPMSDCLDVYLITDHGPVPGQTGRYVVRSMTCAPVTEGASTASNLGPSFRMDYNGAQELMERLWKLGYRPKDLRHSQMVQPALELHLDDMRQIAFAKLHIVKPESTRTSR